MPNPHVQAMSAGLSSRSKFWVDGLTNHKDRAFVNRVMTYIHDGINIDFDGIRNSQESINWPSSFEFSAHVTDYIQEYIEFGSITGPLLEIPDVFKVSPLGAFQKKRSGKIRIIHDLSWPPGNSVNDFISKKDHTVSYTSIDEAILLCKRFDTPFLCKTDLKAAYMTCLVREEDRPLLGFKWDSKSYFWNSIPFGLRSAPFAFNQLADALHYIIIQKDAPCYLLHYLDDYLCISGSYQDAKISLDIMLNVFIDSGFRIQDSKTEGPVRNLEFLGLFLDTEDSQLRISTDRLSEILDLLQTWSEMSYCSKRQLLSLIGKLSFCSKVIKEGRRFMRRLISLSKRMRNLHHKTRITIQAQHDIAWWRACIAKHNGICFFNIIWNDIDSIHMYTDASDIAAGVYVGGKWSWRPFVGSHLWLSQMPIAFRELYAVVLGIALFGKFMVNKNLSLHIDNMAIQISVNSGVCKEPRIMGLLRSFYYYVCLYHINYKSFYIGTSDNAISDSISRSDWVRFRSLCPEAAVVMTPPCDIIWDF